jgi:DNA polymerase-4
MHIDINSCFASIEQQANPLLRDKPVAVAAYDTPNGCVLSPSVQAKKFGIKVAMRIKECKKLCPHLIVLTPDPDKYQFVHLALKTLLSHYTPNLKPRSIDEFILDFEKVPAWKDRLFEAAREIKARIKSEIGDYLTVSIGIAPNRFLAKTASNLHKPDGLDEINQTNFLEVYQSLNLMDLYGISYRNATRLNIAGIYTVTDFFLADVRQLRLAFKSILGLYWFLRLRGWEVDDVDWQTKSFGHTYSPPKALTTPSELAPILSKLVEKMGTRMRNAGFQARGIHLSLIYRNRTYWGHSLTLGQPLFASQDIYRVAYSLLGQAPGIDPVRNIAVSCFNLLPTANLQLGLFADNLKKERLTQAIDKINEKWGDFVISPGTMIHTQEYVKKSIAFGNLRSLV